ncbi:hypothetical protein [Tsukamurella paurometabola]|uniref:Secreted protein n=1 Tax=Tsukamurella paurometabola TaxID=2061 RepID=A0A3P8KS38_TSUPA|nr:hypothetical protein [Tsukamurella paurometabola]MBS4101136.1 hypothetical protein [Tsukamurella paurometabola]UEA82290.1 hypothetical protein LK411_18235 [Tsukamurella paurometabola]VDR39337.1 Uncharacterised protein [Tsukamurella paurometabola]
MTIRTWATRTVSAGLLAAALATPLAGVAAAAPNPAPGAPTAPGAPSTSAARAAYDQWNANRAPRQAASRAAAKATQKDGWTWEGIAPQLDAEQNALRVELGTLPGTIARASSNPQLAGALRTYQARLGEYSRALAADRAARRSGDATWQRSNPALDRLNGACTAVVNAGRNL